MENRVLLVSKELKFNQIYYDYILREYKKIVNHIKSIKFVDNANKELFLTLQEEIDLSDNLLIVTSNDSYKIVSKIITTITNSNLIYKDSNLIPSNTKTYTKNSYLLNFKSKNINVIKYETLKKLPKILIDEHINKIYIQILNETKESLNVILNPIAQSFNVKFIATKVIDELILLEISTNVYGNVEEFIKSINILYNKKLLKDKDIVNFVVEKLREHNLTLSVAESCTGGLISSFITKISGASEIFNASFITYSNEMKSYLLGVNEEIFVKYGAVSKECVEAMLDGVIYASKADFAIAISGIAGPNGGSKEKPVGTIYIGVSDNSDKNIKRFQLKGDREYIQFQGALLAFKLLIELRNDIFLE